MEMDGVMDGWGQAPLAEGDALPFLQRCLTPSGRHYKAEVA